MSECKHDFVYFDHDKEEIICDDCGKDVCADLRAKLAATETELTRISSKANNYAKFNASLEEVVNGLEAKMAAAEERTKVLEKDRDILEEKIITAEKERDEALTQVENLLTEIGTLKSNIAYFKDIAKINIDKFFESQNQVAVLRGALEFYADRDNYLGDIEISTAKRDVSQTANDALQSTPADAAAKVQGLETALRGLTTSHNLFVTDRPDLIKDRVPEGIFWTLDNSKEIKAVMEALAAWKGGKAK